MENIKSDDVGDNKIVAAIGYFWILFLIPLLLKRESDFAQYHAKQALALFIVSTVIGFFVWIPLIGWLLGLATIVLFVFGVVNALSGQKKPLPVIGKSAQKLNL